VGVADISPADAYAVGGHLGSAHTGLVAQWNGSTWTQLTVPLPDNDNMLSDLDAVSAGSASDVWITGTYLFEVNSSDYSEEDYALHWNGSAWAIVPMPLNPGTNPDVGYAINAVKADSPADVWAVGDQYNLTTNTGSTLIEHYNGTAWSIVTSPDGSTGASVLLSVATTPGASIVQAAGFTGSSQADNPLSLRNG
jgi:hypothetical protein